MTERLLYLILAGCLAGAILLAPERETDPPLVRALEEANRE
jgi:hypothetical protein